MKFLNSGNVMRLSLDEIDVEPRLRVVREIQVENLLAMAEDTGITTPIHVRKVKDRYVLIDGAHRLEVAHRLGLVEIAAIVVECRADEARAMEASNNLGAARMTPLQTAVFAASWRDTYYAMHPDRRPGVFKGNRHTGSLVCAENAVTRSIADAFGRKERQIYKIMAVVGKLTGNEIKTLDAAATVVSMEDLEAIGKIGDADERSQVVLKLAHGVAKKVAQARRQIAQENGTIETTKKDPVEDGFNALLKAWERTPLAAKKRFLLERASEVWDAQNKGVSLANWRDASE